MVEIINEANTYLSIKHRDGSVPNEMLFIFSKSGYGKTVIMESIIEEYYRAGYTVLVLADVKDEFELGYAQFPPVKPYHLYRLRKDGKPVKTYPTKIYHPFTFNLPREKLPEINFYGFSLKDLRRAEWSMLCESAWESDTIRLLLNASTSIKDSDGLYGFLHYIQDSILGRDGERGSRKADPKIFHLKTTGGTAKSLQDVASYFLPFKKHLFLLPHNSTLKLDWEKILNDNEHYHVFGTRWIDDEKLKEFCILALFDAIIRNRRFSDKPCLIVIPEIRFLVPLRPKGYKEFLARGIMQNISIMRNLGKGGNSFLTDSQVWMDVEETVKNSATKTFYGQMGGAKDIENIAKANRFKGEISNQLKNPEVPRSFLLQEEWDKGSWNFWLPGHCHKEEEYSFFEMYKKYFPEKMKSYFELMNQMREIYSVEEERIKDKIKKQVQAEKEERERRKAEREEKKKENSGVEQKMEKAEEKESQNKEKLMKICYELFNDQSIDPKERTYRKIGKKVGLNHVTVKTYVRNYPKIKEEKDEVEKPYIPGESPEGYLETSEEG